MTKLQDLVNEMMITRQNRCMGDVWHNQILTEIFSDVNSNKFNQDVAKFILHFIKHENELQWYDRVFTKTQLRKLNSIMKAKTKETQQKRVLSFSKMITSGMYASLFNKNLIKAWIEFCNTHKLEHGLVKVNKTKQYIDRLDSMLANM